MFDTRLPYFSAKTLVQLPNCPRLFRHNLSSSQHFYTTIHQPCEMDTKMRVQGLYPGINTITPPAAPPAHRNTSLSLQPRLYNQGSSQNARPPLPFPGSLPIEVIDLTTEDDVSISGIRSRCTDAATSATRDVTAEDPSIVRSSIMTFAETTETEMRNVGRAAHVLERWRDQEDEGPSHLLLRDTAHTRGVKRELADVERAGDQHTEQARRLQRREGVEHMASAPPLTLPLSQSSRTKLTAVLTKMILLVPCKTPDGTGKTKWDAAAHTRRSIHADMLLQSTRNKLGSSVERDAFDEAVKHTILRPEGKRRTRWKEAPPQGSVAALEGSRDREETSPSHRATHHTDDWRVFDFPFCCTRQAPYGEGSASGETDAYTQAGV